MKKIIYCIVTLLIVINFYPLIANANIVCNDGTISPSCSDCHRGCCSRHGGCTNNPSSSSGSSSNSNSSSNNSNTSKEKVKSSDATLKKVTVDKQNITISNNMKYTAKTDKVTILAVANDTKAKVDYQQNPSLKIGDNNIYITVTAENGQTQKYTLNIIREKKIVNIRIFVEEKEVTFDSFQSEIITIPYDKNEVDIKYDIYDEDSKVEITGNKNLKVGYNEITVKVISNSDEEQDYIIRINKEEHQEEIQEDESQEENKEEQKDENTVIDNQEESDTEDTTPNVIVPVLFVGGTGYLIYYFIKQKK